MFKRIHRPSPAMFVALVALFVALGGTAGAVTVTVVPLAKRALVADNAQKLQGKTPAALLQQASMLPANPATHASIAAMPSPASTAAGLVSVKSLQWSLVPGAINTFTVTCDTGQKALSGGYDDPGGWAHAWDSKPTPDGGGWAMMVNVSRSATTAQSGYIYVVCLK